MIYFDNSATSRFKPACMLRAMRNELEKSSNGGRSGHRDAVSTAIKISAVRTFLCDYLNANELIFTKNCTEALNIAIFGTVKYGGHALTTVNEHNSVLRPLFKLERDKSISLSVVNPDANLKNNPAHIERMLRPETYLVAVNAVSNVTGVASDLEAIGSICKKRGILFLVDAAQALPHVSINMKKLGIGFLASAGHKGLHGPQGTGFLALNSLTGIQPLLYGGTGTNSDSVYQPHALPEALEAGTLNSAGIIGLGEAVRWTIKNIGKINRKTEELNQIVLYGLKNMKNVEVYTPDGTECGVISFNVKGMDSTEVGDILNERYDIAVRTGLHCAPLIHNHLGTLERGAVRVSIGYNNSKKDALRLLDAVSEISRPI